MLTNQIEFKFACYTVYSCVLAFVHLGNFSEQLTIVL